MKAAAECYGCLQRLVYQAADLATKDEQIRANAAAEGTRVLKGQFSLDKVTVVIASQIHDVVKQVTGNPDPYRGMKDREVGIAQELSRKIKMDYGQGFVDYLRFAARGNAIDFFRHPDIIREDLGSPVDFVIDDSREFLKRLKGASKVLYLADNAGEILFDLPLLRWMKQFASVTFVVKASPVQNDVTPGDIRRAGLEGEVGRVITTGTATPGIDFSAASAEFKHEFEVADLVFAKGMGYYESLSELPARGRVFHCLMAKCTPVAISIGVPLNSYVAMLR